MDLWRIAIRALVAYVYLMVTTRASGKRVVSQATPFDFVVSLIIGDLIDDLLWAEVSVAKFGAAVAAIFVCDAFVKIGAFHSTRFMHLVNGLPRAILRDGLEDGKALRREQLNEEDLAHLLRLDGIDRDKWNDVHLAVLERDHETSVILKPTAEPAKQKDARRAVQLEEQAGR
jgi:uncharacterized membrane protein YcaP (DUF421 family)